MAKKPESSKDVTFKVASKKAYDSFMASVDTTKGKLDSIRMENANEWKRAETLNIHSAVAKLMLKLRKMDDLRRADFLRSFDVYREYEEFEVSDLIDNAEEKARSEAQAKENDATRQAELDKQKAAAAEGQDETTDPAPAAESETEIADSFDVEDEDDARELGNQACIKGINKQHGNPYDEDDETDNFEAWIEGWEDAFKTGLFGTDEDSEAA